MLATSGEEGGQQGGERLACVQHYGESGALCNVFVHFMTGYFLVQKKFLKVFELKG